MSQMPVVTTSQVSWRLLLAGALTAAVPLTPLSAEAFYQQTSLEGPVGSDLGGVWLSVQNVGPEFRISFPRPEAGPAIPLEVSPPPASMEALVGPKPMGVAIKKCDPPGFCNQNGLLEGDVIVAVNSRPITDMASYESALTNPAKTMLLSIRRPALQMTTVRLVKIRYQAESAEQAEAEADSAGTSVAVEALAVKVVDAALPFADKVEESRSTHVLFQPSAEQVQHLADKWSELERNAPPLYVNGKHRFIARSMFDESLNSDRSLDDSKFALIMDLKSNPTSGGGGQVIDVYGIESVGPRELSGNYVSVTIANAPFPINIEFKGRFRMTRIADYSDLDDKVQAARAAAMKPKDDLDKYETLPEVPAPGTPAPKVE